jgi:glucosyl-3-phosphoglycerate synthase
MSGIQASWENVRDRVRKGIDRAWRATLSTLHTSEHRERSAPHQSEPTLVSVTPRANVSVVIPALNEARHIASVVSYALSDPATAEVIVIDDSSIDDTADLARAAGAKVIRSTMLGKGESMRDGAHAAAADIVVYLDGDLHELKPGVIGELAAPIVVDGADFVKAKFGRSGGRVTELTAKPMLRIFFPELSHFSQPLGGIIAARRSLLKTMKFERDYGVDVGLLIDCHRAGATVVEIDIGSLRHESQSLSALGHMAQEVSRTIFERAKDAGRLSVDQVLSVYEMDRQHRGDIEVIQERLHGAKKIALLCLDGVVTKEDYLSTLAKNTRTFAELRTALREEGTRADESWHVRASETFRFLHRKTFERVALELPLQEGIVDCVNQLKRAGYTVGVVSDSYFIAAEILRRRIFADFAIGNFMQFDGGVSQGKVRVNRAFAHEEGCRQHLICTSNVMIHLRQSGALDATDHVIAVGARSDDRCLLRLADFAFAMASGDASLLKEPGIARVDSLSEVVSAAQVIERESLGGDKADREQLATI